MKTLWGQHILVALLLSLSFCLSSQATEKDVYDFKWLDPDKSVYVLQNKVYKKAKTWYADASFLKGLSSTYEDTKGFDIKGGYYFHEEWAVELYHTEYFHKNNENYVNIMRLNGTVPFVRHLNNATGALLIWSPFYGKINTFNRIYYFDWSFGAGVAKLNAESNINTVRDPLAPNYFVKEKYTAGVLKTELRFYLSKKVHIGIELRNSFYQAPSAANPGQKNLKTNTDALFSIGYSF